MLPDSERADAIGSYWANSQGSSGDVRKNPPSQPKRERHEEEPRIQDAPEVFLIDRLSSKKGADNADGYDYGRCHSYPPRQIDDDANRRIPV
jgi:hypothetical protein